MYFFLRMLDRLLFHCDIGTVIIGSCNCYPVIKRTVVLLIFKQWSRADVFLALTLGYDQRSLRCKFPMLRVTAKLLGCKLL